MSMQVKVTRRRSLAVTVVGFGLALSPAARADVTIDPEGSWHDLAGQYVKGDQTYELGVCFGGDTAINRVALEEVNVAGYVFEDWIDPSPSRGSEEPAVASRSTSCPGGDVDSTLLAEGAHNYRALAWGAEEYASAAWTVYVDHTPPSWPTVLAGLDAVFDPDANTAEVSWNAATDPSLADNSRGSGVDHYD
jgi:hypothetical protein